MPETYQEDEVICCAPRYLPGDQIEAAAQVAHEENPANRPNLEALSQVMSPDSLDASFISVITTKYWRTNGVRLGVGFMDNPPNELRTRILSHMNAWGASANVEFRESFADPAVRIARDQPGYWSYVGTDILLIERNKPTMNLQGFTMNTPDSEFYRVVRHETGHTLGCPHEHMRQDIIAQIDERKAIQYYGATQGWNEAQVRAQVLTPLSPNSIWGTVSSDRQSIMCYQIPAAITKNGVAIPGGLDIDPIDYAFMAQVYPKPAAVAGAQAEAGPQSPILASAPARHGYTHRHDCPGCIDVTLASGNSLSVPPEATESQLRTVLGALR